jgi:hypothetical protein
MSKPVERIQALIGSLPERDIPLGYKFLSERNFDSLKELIDSAIYKVRKSLKSDNPKEEYLKVNLEDLSGLKFEVDMYIAQLEIPEDDIYNEDFDDCEIEEEFY